MYTHIHTCARSSVRAIQFRRRDARRSFNDSALLCSLKVFPAPPPPVLVSHSASRSPSSFLDFSHWRRLLYFVTWVSFRSRLRLPLNLPPVRSALSAGSSRGRYCSMALGGTEVPFSEICIRRNDTSFTVTYICVGQTFFGDANLPRQVVLLIRGVSHFARSIYMNVGRRSTCTYMRTPHACKKYLYSLRSVLKKKNGNK